MEGSADTMTKSDDARKQTEAQAYAEWERRRAEIMRENEVLLSNFEAWLAAKGLGNKTIRDHRLNVDFFINNYLVYYEELHTAAEGVSMVGGFLDSWFPHKALWASPAAIKGNAASFKKFYTFMNELGLVVGDDLEELKEEIKECLPDWMAGTGM